MSETTPPPMVAPERGSDLAVFERRTPLAVPAPSAGATIVGLVFGLILAVAMAYFTGGDLAYRIGMGIAPVLLSTLFLRAVSVRGQAEWMLQVDRDGLEDLASRKGPSGLLPEGVVKRTVEDVGARMATASLIVDPRGMAEDAGEILMARMDPLRHVASASVFVGLLGTLGGLTVAVISLQGAGEFASAQDVPTFLKAAASTLVGFGIAFVSAGLGVFASIILNMWANRYDLRVHELTERLSEVVVWKLVPQLEAKLEIVTPAKAMAEISGLIHALRTEIPPVLDNLRKATSGADTMVNTLQRTASISLEVGLKLENAVKAMAESQTALLERTTQLAAVAVAIQRFQNDFEAKGAAVFDSISASAEEFRRAQTAFHHEALRLEKAVQDASEGIRKQMEAANDAQVSLLGGLLESLQSHQIYTEQIARIVSGIPQVVTVGGTGEAAQLRAQVEDANRRTSLKLEELGRVLVEMEGRIGGKIEQARPARASTRRSETQDPTPPVPTIAGVPPPPPAPPKGFEKLKSWFRRNRGDG